MAYLLFIFSSLVISGFEVGIFTDSYQNRHISINGGPSWTSNSVSDSQPTSILLRLTQSQLLSGRGPRDWWGNAMLLAALQSTWSRSSTVSILNIYVQPIQRHLGRRETAAFEMRWSEGLEWTKRWRKRRVCLVSNMSQRYLIFSLAAHIQERTPAIAPHKDNHGTAEGLMVGLYSFKIG